MNVRRRQASLNPGGESQTSGFRLRVSGGERQTSGSRQRSAGIGRGASNVGLQAAGVGRRPSSVRLSDVGQGSHVRARKKYIIEEDEPLEKKRKYAVWEEDNNIVMAWIMNIVESRIAPTIAYYTKAKDMWSFLQKTYSHATNVIKILQLEEELCNIRQGDQDLSQYFATLTAAYERLKALRPPCKHCYASHFETGMVAKFLSGLSEKYSVAKSQILTESDLPDLADTYNRLSRLAVTLTRPTHDTPVSALVVSGGHGHSSFQPHMFLSFTRLTVSLTCALFGAPSVAVWSPAGLPSSPVICSFIISQEKNGECSTGAEEECNRLFGQVYSRRRVCTDEMTGVPALTVPLLAALVPPPLPLLPSIPAALAAGFWLQPGIVA
ncbi:hypothetical protein EJ110_NYTH47620 [Nymphaea thermarum]|nr:hypothetical protein EJ110_NYTH47620 [Nymphaea thermarum]